MGEHSVGATLPRSVSPRELQVWRTYIETSGRMGTFLGSLLAESGVSASDYPVLLVLSEARGQRLRSSALAEHLGWERSRLSHHLGRMQARGLISRENCATDNRGAEIVLTAEGAIQLRRTLPAHMRAIRDHFVEVLSPAQLEALGAASAALARHLDR